MGAVLCVIVVLMAGGLMPAPAAQAAGPPRCDGRVATIVGTAGADDLVGTPRADVIVGLDGKDHIDGLGGNDRICGGGGPDTLLGGDGADRLFGQENGMHSDRGGTYIIGDVLDGGEGDDLLDLGDASPPWTFVSGERLEFLSSPEAVVVDLAAGTATGQGNDVVRYIKQMAVLTGEGDDTILGTKWAETADAGAGNDIVSLRGGPDTVRERRTTLPDDDVVNTGAGPDTVRAVSGADRIATGGAHDDVALEGLGPFTLDAGGDYDWVFARITNRPGASYDLGEDREGELIDGDYLSFEPGRFAGANGSLPLRVDVPAGLVVTTAGGVSVSAAISGVERYAFRDGLALDFLGGDDAESLEGPAKPALHAVMGAGDDTVYGTLGRDYIDGGDGVDWAIANAGHDTCVQVEKRSSC